MACVSKGHLSTYIKLHRVRIIALAGFIYFSSPVIILFLFVLQILRKIIELITKTFWSDVHCLVSGYCSLKASDDLYGIPSHNVVGKVTLKCGNMSLELLQKVIYDKVIVSQTTNGTLFYPQLRQYPVQLNGFSFWRWDQNFTIENHVRVHEKVQNTERVLVESEILQMQNNLLRKQWKKFQSPWEILIIPYYKNDNSILRDSSMVLFIRFHESLGDSFSFFNLFISNLCDCDNAGHHVPRRHNHVQTPQPISSKNNILNYTKLALETCKRYMITFKFPYHLAQEFLDTPETHDWIFPEKDLLKRDHLETIENFSIQHVRDIKAILGVSFTSVLLATLAAAIRSTFLSQGLKVPKTVKVRFPISNGYDTKGNYLGNNLSPCAIKLPVGLSSAKDRLRYCENAYRDMMKSNMMTLHVYFSNLLGLLPSGCSGLAKQFYRCSGTVSNLPSTFEYLSIAGHPIEEFVVASNDDSGFVVTFLSYVDSIRVSASLDHRVIPSSQQNIAKDFLKYIYLELVNLGVEGVV